MPYEYSRAFIDELASMSERVFEDRLYEIAIDEIQNNEMDPVSEARAFEEAEGNKEKARAFYTKHRVRRLRDHLLQEIDSAKRYHDEEMRRRKIQEQEEAREREWLRNMSLSDYERFMERLGRKFSRRSKK